MPSADEIRAGRAYVEVRADTTKLKEDLRDNGRILDALNENFGSRSEIGHLAHALEGGGALLGLTLLGRSLNEVTAKAVEMRNALEDGSKSAGDVADELLRSLPVLGNIWSAGRNIRELFTGEEAALRAAREEAQRIEAIIAATNKLHEDAVASLKTLADISGQLRFEWKSLGADPTTKAWLDSTKALGEQLDKIRAKAAEGRDKLTKDLKVAFPDEKDVTPQSLLTRRGSIERSLMPLEAKLAERVAGAQNLRTPWAWVDEARAEVDPLKKQLSQINNALKIYNEGLRAIDAGEIANVGLTLRNFGGRIGVGLAGIGTGIGGAFGRAFESLGIDLGQKRAASSEASRRAMEQLDSAAEQAIDDYLKNVFAQAPSFRAANDPWAKFEQEVEHAMELKAVGVISQSDFDLGLKNYARALDQQLQQAMGISHFSLGTANPAAIQSLKYPGSIEQRVADNVDRMKDLLQRIEQSVRNRAVFQ